MQTEKQTDRHQAPAYPLRLPADVKTKLAAAATKSRRSLNGEIVSRLEKSLESNVSTMQGAEQ